MINYNGKILVNKGAVLSSQNRSFCYGDGIFETLRIKEGKPQFLQLHYFRLMAGMRMIRMEIPMFFTETFMSDQIAKLMDACLNKSIRKIRWTVFRQDGGTYAPKTNDISYLIEAFDQTTALKSSYVIDVYKDFLVPQTLLSNIKSNNRMINVLAGVYANDNNLDACILLNQEKRVCEATHANLFIVKERYHIITPPITEGCISGVARKKVIEILEKHPLFSIEESTISPFEVQKVKEVFLTNALVGVQPVTQYRKKKFETTIGNTVRTLLEQQI